jgi:hypothetical protein
VSRSFYMLAFRVWRSGAHTRRLNIKSLDGHIARALRTTKILGIPTTTYASVTTTTTLNMATPYKIQLDLKQRPIFSVSGLTEEGARKASELLQKNHEEHHIFFNKDGFHVSSFLQL